MAAAEYVTSADLDPISSAGAIRKATDHTATHPIFLARAGRRMARATAVDVYTSLRSKTEHGDSKGYLSVPSKLTFTNYSAAWSQAGFAQAFKSSAYITIPSVILKSSFALD